MIDILVQTVAGKLGISENQAKMGIGIALRLLKQKGDNSAVASLLSQIPGSAELLNDYGNPKPTGGLGGLMGGLGSMIGGEKGEMMEIMGDLESTGISIDQAKSLLPEVGSFLRANADEETVSQVINSIPQLKGRM